MEEIEKRYDLIEVLKETADKFQPQFLNQLRKELGPRELEILDFLFKEYYRKDKTKGRWWDPYHILFSTCFTVKLVKINKQISPLIITGSLLHDIGYHFIEDKDNWDASQNRIVHMQEGGAETAKILTMFGTYSYQEVGIIVGMVTSHDNSYLDIRIRNPDRLALQDADRICLLHPLIFYKDWISRRKKKEGFSLPDLFQRRLNYFYGVEESLPVPGIRDRNNSSLRVSYTSLAKEWRDRQFKDRWQEIQNNITDNEKVFRETIERYIRAELKEGRG